MSVCMSIDFVLSISTLTITNKSIYYNQRLQHEVFKYDEYMYCLLPFQCNVLACVSWYVLQLCNLISERVGPELYSAILFVYLLTCHK